MQPDKAFNAFLPVLLLSLFAAIIPFAQIHKLEKQIRTGDQTLMSRDLVDEFYQLNHQKPFWFDTSGQSRALRKSFSDCLDSFRRSYPKPEDYHYEELRKYADSSFISGDSSERMVIDRLYTDAAITMCGNLFWGQHMASWISSDEISPGFFERDKKIILEGLLNAGTDSGFLRFVYSLEPADAQYLTLKHAFSQRMAKQDSARAGMLAVSLNFMRWISHFGFSQYAVVNIPSAKLRFYGNDSLRLAMKVVVGKPSTKTPRIATYCNQIILYPYWNVPRKIVIKEMLPMIKKNPGFIDSNNMQLIDSRGHIVDYHKLNWSLYNKSYFPFELRQSTGCDNALGVIKFNLTDPYDVYMHDTNLKRAFSSERRFYSHGCIRLEKPILLANYLLDNAVDSNFLLSCFRDQKPVPVQLKQSLPVFVVYMPAEADSLGHINYFRDIYGLLKH